MKGLPVISFFVGAMIPRVRPETGFINLTWFLQVQGACDLYKRIRFSLGRN